MELPRWAEDSPNYLPSGGGTPWWSLAGQQPQQQSDPRNPFLTRTVDPARQGDVGGALSDMVQGLTGWTPGTTPSWVPQWVRNQSDSNDAAMQAHLQGLAKYGFTPDDMNIAMSFGMGSTGEARPMMRRGLRPPASLMGRPYVETMPAAPVAPAAAQEIQQLQHEQRFADATGGGESRIARGRDALINQAVGQGRDLVNSPEFKAWKKGGGKGARPKPVSPPVPEPAPSSSFEDWSKAMAALNNQATMSMDPEDVLSALRGRK